MRALAQNPFGLKSQKRQTINPSAEADGNSHFLILKLLLKIPAID
jgi:hypothetical protein